MTIIYIDDTAVPLIEGGGGGGGCFSADTLIACDSYQKPISDIEVGDKVWAFDEIGELILSSVTETFYHPVDEIYRVTHEYGYLDITPNHWVLKEDGDYQELKDFNIGDKLLTDNNELSEIFSIEFLKTDEVYNFKVSHYHSYIANGIKVHNGGGGGKSGGGGGREDPNNLFSTDIMFLTLGLSEGPVYRINPNGPIDIEFNEGFIDDLLDSDQQIDSEKFYVLSNTGTLTQSPLPLFGDYTFLAQRLSSAVELKKGNASGVPRSAVDKQNTSPTPATALKFYFIIGGLQRQDDDGNILGNSLTVKATIYDSTGVEELGFQERTISGKTNVAFSFDLFIQIPADKLSDAGYRYTIEKTSSDNASSKVQESVTFQGWTEIVDQPIAYTRTATVGYAIKAFAEHKGSMPAISNLIKGLIVKVPANYNQPILENGDIDWRQIEINDVDRADYGYRQQKTGTAVLNDTNPTIYEGLWDGQFVYSWTQNPVWHIYDLLTNTTYGLGIPEGNIDKFSFYDAAVYNDACDVTNGKFYGVDAKADGSFRNKPRNTKTSVKESLIGYDVGTSIKERRFILDSVIADQKQVIDLITILTLTFRSILYYTGGKIYLHQDKPDDMPSAIFNETNIKRDSLLISGMNEEDLVTGVDVSYIDVTNHNRRETLRIDDPRALNERNGIENVVSLQLEGINRKSQAIRLAQYLIADKKYSKRKISFDTGIVASELRPGSIISVSQRAASVAWGYGGLIQKDSIDGISNTSIYLEHIGVPSITSTVFTANTKPLAVRVASTKSGLVDTYLISNTSYSLSNTANVSGGTEYVRVEAIRKYDVGSKTFEVFSGGWGSNHLPSRFDLWTLGEVNDPTNIYTSLTDKLFKVSALGRSKEEIIKIEAVEYVSNVYVDADTLIDYQPLVFTDLFNPLLKPPAPDFALRAIPKRDLDGSVYTDIEISAFTDRTGYSNEFVTEYYRARPTTDLKLVSNATPSISRDIITMHLDAISDVTEGEKIIIYGKNGFTTEFGRSRLLVTATDQIDDAPDKANGNISLTVVGIDNLIDVNFGDSIHVLDVNDTFDFGGVKGTDKVTLPINQKEESGTGDAAGLLGFIGSDTRLTNYSANVVAWDSGTQTIKIDNDHSGTNTLYTLLPDPPFYISLNQIIDHRYFANNALYVTGNYQEIVRTNTATTTNLINSHIFKQPLGVSVRHSGFTEVYINGEAYTNFNLEKGLDNLANSQVSINLTTLPTSEANLDVRVVSNVYTVPLIELGDNIAWNAGNVYGISDSTYDTTAPSYDAALTANGIYRVILSDNIKSNVAQAYAINVTPDPIGTVGNLNVAAKTFTFDYNSTVFPGLLNLANNSVYTVNVPLDNFIPISIDESTNSRIIKRVETGVHAVKARNINKFGRRSPFVTKQVVVRPLPIKAVANLEISESLYKDSTLGVATRVLISFDSITGQEVTDYEISYKINSDGGDLTSFNTIKVPAIGTDTDGKIRFKIDNIERGLSGNPNSVVVRVTPLNKNIRGSTIVKEQSIVGKSAKPLNVINFAVGQSGESLVFIWQYVQDITTGDNYDLDLLEVQIKRIASTTESSQAALLDAWASANDLAKVDARTNRVVIDIDQYGPYTYLVRTRDTSGNLSEDVVTSNYTSISTTYNKVFAAYSEDDPSGAYVPGFTNTNYGETAYASYYESNTGGLSYSKADSLFDSSSVDNANGASSGWSVIGGSPSDLRALSTAVYQTQIRDLGSTLTASIQLELLGEQALKSTWLDYSEQVGEDAVTESAPAGSLRDIDFSGALGIGNILGYSNASAATVSYDSKNKTLVSGTSGSYYANVYGIITTGNYDGDTANANVLSLISGVSNGSAIVLGDSWYANGRSTGSNGFSNLTVAGTSYKLVNLTQWLDLSPEATFYGTSGIVTTNTEFRVTSSNPYYANGNVNVSAFTAVANSDGYVNFVTGARTFRYFQFRYKVNNSNPQQAELILDKFRYRIALDERLFTQTVTITTAVTFIDYAQMGYVQIPRVTATTISASSNQLAQPQCIVLDRGVEGANISVYFSNGVSSHDIIGPSSIYTEVDFAVTGV